MGFVLDLILFAIMGGLLFIHLNKPVSSSLMKTLCVLLSLTLACALSNPLGKIVDERLLRPIVEQNAANELADLFSAEHLANGKDTVASLSFDEMIVEAPEPFVDVLSRYGTDIEEVRVAYRVSPKPQTVLSVITEGFSQNLSKAIALLLVWIVPYFLLRLLTIVWERNLRAPRRLKGARRAVPPLLGLIKGIVIAMGVCTILELLVPILYHRLIFFPLDIFDQSVIYGIFTNFNVFSWLLS